MSVSKISVVINTLNEASQLSRVLNSVKDFADEIVVVDMKSDDNTQEIAKKLKAKVYDHVRMSFVEPARNFAIGKATGDWILILDPDEELSPELATKLKDITKLDNADYVAIPRKNIIFGKWMQHSRWWPDYNIRFFKKGKVTWNDEIHSVPMTNGRGMDLEVTQDLAIIHHHYESIDQFVERLNRYTTQQAKSKQENNYSFKWEDLITKPSAEFLSRYFFGKGYKDGLHGLAVASLQAFSELILYLKLWQLNDFKEKEINYKDVIDVMKHTQKEENYWMADTFVNEHGGFTSKVKRKLKLP